MKLSTAWLVASIACGLIMFVSSNPIFWFFLSLAFLWRSDFHQLSEQLLELKERLDGR